MHREGAISLCRPETCTGVEHIPAFRQRTYAPRTRTARLPRPWACDLLISPKLFTAGSGFRHLSRQSHKSALNRRLDAKRMTAGKDVTIARE